jgi:diguanylate cyclase (GGDEF)-like protein
MITRKQPRSSFSHSLDLLSDLTRAKTEEEAIRDIIHIFSTIFQPQEIIYIAVQGDLILSVRPREISPDAVKDIMQRVKDTQPNDSIIETAGMVILTIANQTDIFGHVSLDFGEVIKPDQHSLNFGRLLANYAGVVTSNLRARQKIDDIRNFNRTTSLEGFTGLSSKRYFFEIAEAEFRRSKRYNRPLSAILIDIDNFKTVNDTFGFEAGNHILTEFSRLLHKELREPDIRVRMGGEEFLILLPETKLRYAQTLAERLRRRISGMTFDVENQTAQITISIGVTSLDQSIQNLEDFIQSCDQALTMAEHGGKNQVSTWAAPLAEYETTFILPESDYRIGFY